MSPRDAVRALAFGRIAIGVALLIAPRLFVRLSVGPDGHPGTTSVIGRALGARDALVGGMLLHTADHEQIGKRWISTCAALDAVDAAAALAAPDLPRGRRLLFLLIAGGSAVAHGVLAQQQIAAPDASAAA